MSLLARLSDCARFYVRRCALAADPGGAQISEQQMPARVKTKQPLLSLFFLYTWSNLPIVPVFCAVAISENSAVSGISEAPKSANCLGFEWLGD